MNMQESTQPLDLASVREKLSAENGKRFWRSLEELADTPQFRDFLHREFPREASVWENGPSRRSFLKLAGASMALAGLSACGRQPEETIVPYVKQPEQLVPGKAMYFATAMLLGGYAQGTLVESHTGRPTKIEGNPNHPASRGATDIFTQATLLTMYDPDRNQAITQVGNVRPWQEFAAAMAGAVADQQSKRGAGLRFLTPTVTSPTLADQMKSVQLALPSSTWHTYEPINNDNERHGAEMAFNQYVDTIYHFDQADVIVSLDADFLYWGPGHVRYARDFASRRDADAQMNRMYIVESSVSITGSVADHRMALQHHEVEVFARHLARAMGVSVPAPDLGSVFEDTETISTWIAEIAADLKAHQGASVVVPGRDQSAIVHALAHAINGVTGSISSEGTQGTVTYVSPVAAKPQAHVESLRELVDAMNAGEVDTLIILGGNPVYDAPADLNISDAMTKVSTRVYHGLYFNETADRCHWVIPAAHELESWSDARAYDGTTTIIQPLIEPLYTGKTTHEILAAVLGSPEKKPHDIVKDFWRGRFGADDPEGFERFWRTALSEGVVAAQERAGVVPEAYPVSQAPKTDFGDASYTAPEEGISVVFRADPTIYDGHFANNGWLQELPKPLSKVTWENAILIAPATAERLGLYGDDIVEVTVNGETVEGTVWTQPGHPLNSITVHLGYGRSLAGRIGDGIGFNGYLIRTSNTMNAATGAEITRTGIRRQLARTEQHHSIEYGQIRGMEEAMDAAERRELIRVATADEYHENPHFAQLQGYTPAADKTLYPRWEWDGPNWGMTIDLNTCTGCGACTIACQAENNIAVVGREEVLMGREMHWIRVDRYYRGDLDNPETYHQPIPCMQCETAPCEVVCPVAATVHSAEGLNDMVYNRCVGTRYCSNNCPYKVRRFNFFHYSKMQYGGGDYESLKLMRNPNVTVRSRGVMEKCTYCVQRINAARIEAKKNFTDEVLDGNAPEKVMIPDGAIQTACQQACPSNAIIFGDIADPDSLVAEAKRSPRNYGLLTVLNTRPRTTYLAKVTNPNPALAKG